MAVLPVVTIKDTSSKDDFIIINEEDFDPETMELFVDSKKAASVKEPTAEIESDVVKKSVSTMTIEECRKILDRENVEYNRNFGVRKLRELVKESCE